jgi:hypothetical protein
MIDGIAAWKACSKPHVQMTIQLALLAPDLVRASIDGSIAARHRRRRLFEAPCGRASAAVGILGLAAALGSCRKSVALVGLPVRTAREFSRRQRGAPNSTTKKEPPWPVNGGL